MAENPQRAVQPFVWILGFNDMSTSAPKRNTRVYKQERKSGKIKRQYTVCKVPHWVCFSSRSLWTWIFALDEIMCILFTQREKLCIFMALLLPLFPRQYV